MNIQARFSCLVAPLWHDCFWGGVHGRDPFAKVLPWYSETLSISLPNPSIEFQNMAARNEIQSHSISYFENQYNRPEE